MTQGPDRLTLAQTQLARVQVAAFDPVDWSDLSMYGLYALENAVTAAADFLAIPWSKSHWNKARTADELHASHGLPDVAALLYELNELRKGEAYGEFVIMSLTDPEKIATDIQDYVDAVAAVMGR